MAIQLISDGGPATDYPPTMWALLRRAATDRPQDQVLADDHGRALATLELLRAAESVAAGLVERGVRAGTVVSWQLPTILESVVLMLALARLGVVQNPLIPVLREREVKFITDQVGTNFLVVPTTWRGFHHGEMAHELARAGQLTVIEIDLEAPTGADDLRLPHGDISSLPPEPLDRPVGDAMRWVYYSSGTTGEPKGARHSDASVMASASGMVEGTGFGPDDVYPIAWPISHIGGSTMLTTSLTTGTRLVLFDSFDPATTPERMATHGPTFLGTALPFFRSFIDAQQRHGAEPLFPSVRAGTFGGAPIPASLHDELRDALGLKTVMGSWGLTEFPIATSARLQDPADVLRQSVGRPSPGVTVRVGSSDGSGVSATGEGELSLRGPQRLIGYVDSALDADAFDADGWFRTGDLGTIDVHGNVRISGRSKDVIIRNAENISALEIEEVIRAHPSVSDVVALGLPDARTGERVCVVVVVEDGHSFGFDTLISWCTEVGLSRYKHPEQLELASSLPRDAMGKVRKQILRTQLARE
jgi:cyclohexanecarboxylate-CoA ligase